MKSTDLVSVKHATFSYIQCGLVNENVFDVHEENKQYVWCKEFHGKQEMQVDFDINMQAPTVCIKFVPDTKDTKKL